jgi:type IV secretion system protein VirB10
MPTPHDEKQEDGLPRVAEKKANNPLVLLGLVLIVGVFIFGLFGTHRPAKTSDHWIDENYTPAPLPRRALPSQPLAKTEKVSISDAQRAWVQAKQQELAQRLHAPLVMVKAEHSTPSPGALREEKGMLDANTQFMHSAASESPSSSRVMLMGPLHSLIAEGSFIPAVLETAIHSDLPGRIRAMVNRSVYAEDGSHVLIPRGSRLIGRYQSGLTPGQNRVFVVWTRLIMPNGRSMMLGSPGTNAMGQAGMDADSVHHHFWQQFGTAALISLIGAGAANVGVQSSDQFNASQAYRMAMANSLAQTAQQNLQQQGVIPPTVTIHQGQPILVFVAKDLDFRLMGELSAPPVND